VGYCDEERDYYYFRCSFAGADGGCCYYFAGDDLEGDDLEGGDLAEGDDAD